MERHFLSVKEVAGLLGVNPRTVYNMCWGKEIPHIMVGANIRIHKDAVKLLVEEGARRALNPRSSRGGGARIKYPRRYPEKPPVTATEEVEKTETTA